MAIHSLYPGFIKVYYTCGTNEHVMVWPVVPQVIPMVIGSTPMLTLNDGTFEAWNTAAPKLVTHILGLYPATATFTRMEIFGMDAADGDPYYVRGQAIAGGTGTNGGAGVAWSMAVASMRTDQGGLFKLYMMESCLNANQEYTGPTYGGITALDDTIDHLVGTDGCVRGRDGGILLSNIKVKTKTSDALRKKYL